MSTFRRFGALILAVFSLSLSAEPEPAPVVVAAYNVQNWLEMKREVDGRSVSDAPKPEEERTAVVDVIAGIKPDILGIVEIGSRQDLKDLQSLLKDAGLDYPHAEIHEADDDVRRVALLSKFPIVENNSQKGITFDLNGVRHPMARGILDMTVQINPDYQLRLLGVHLKSKRKIDDYDEAEMRANEAIYLKNTINNILAADPDTNLLLFGDLNDTKNEFPISQLLSGTGSPTSLTDLQLADSVGDRWTHFWRWADLYSRIDYLIASPGLVPEIVEERNGVDRSENWLEASDHRAIYTAIRPQNQ